MTVKQCEKAALEMIESSLVKLVQAHLLLEDIDFHGNSGPTVRQGSNDEKLGIAIDNLTSVMVSLRKRTGYYEKAH